MFSNRQFLFAVAVLAGTAAVPAAAGDVVERHIVVDRKTVDITGEPIEAMAVNGSIPGPTLRYTEGDIARIHVENRLDVDTSVHWHGLLLPNRQDGVPYLTTPPIKAGTTYTFEFPLRHSGVYWYHSHTGLQEQRGVYGSIVVDPVGGDDVKADADEVVVLSDWTNEDPGEVLALLKRGDHWAGIRKGTLPTIVGAIRNDASGEYWKQAWDRMPPMDISDVYYDAFLANGRREMDIPANAGDVVRLRFINAAASTYFYLGYAGGPFEIIAADGPRVRPLSKDRMLMAIAETYEVLVRVPDEGRYELRATAQDGSGYASIWIGSGGKRHAAPDVPPPDLYRLHGGHDMPAMAAEDSDVTAHGSMGHESMGHESMGHESMGHESMGHESMDHGSDERPMPPYDELRALHSTALDADAPLKEVELRLNGDMERYVWSMNGRTLSEADRIHIRKGQRVRFVLINETMMHHPMHLHGHFFRVLRSDGSAPDDLPLKHTVDVPPMGRTVIEFAANEEKDWFFHCHVLYHMKSGMSRIVSYEDSKPDADIAAMQGMLAMDPYYLFGTVSLMTQMSEGAVRFQNTRNTFALDWENGWGEAGSGASPGEAMEYAAFARYERYFDRYVSAFLGVEARREHVDVLEQHFGYSDVHEQALEDTRVVAGLHYLLPLRVESTLWVDEDGEARVELKRHFQLTLRTQFELEYRYDTLLEDEWAAAMEYRFNRDLSGRVGYHSEFGGGAGITWRF